MQKTAEIVFHKLLQDCISISIQSINPAPYPTGVEYERMKKPIHTHIHTEVGFSIQFVLANFGGFF